MARTAEPDPLWKGARSRLISPAGAGEVGTRVFMIGSAYTWVQKRLPPLAVQLRGHVETATCFKGGRFSLRLCWMAKAGPARVFGQLLKRLTADMDQARVVAAFEK
jgi:hypothetical protein